MVIYFGEVGDVDLTTYFRVMGELIYKMLLAFWPLLITLALIGFILWLVRMRAKINPSGTMRKKGP
jgi:hypothetical protein